MRTSPRSRTRRLCTLAHSMLQALDAATVRAVVRQAVRDIRTAPPPPPADPTVAALRRVVDDVAASTHAIEELMLEVAPAYLPHIEAADVPVLLCDQLGEPLARTRPRRPPLRDLRRPSRPPRHRL